MPIPASASGEAPLREGGHYAMLTAPDVVAVALLELERGEGP
jgi:hypothetical protein